MTIGAARLELLASAYRTNLELCLRHGIQSSEP